MRLQQRRLLETYDGVARNFVGVDAPPAGLTPIDLRFRRNGPQRRKIGRRDAVEQAGDSSRRLPSNVGVGRHAPAYDPGSDECAKRPIDRCGGCGHHEHHGFAGHEQLVGAILEVAGRKHHVVVAQLAQSLHHRVSRQARKKLDGRNNVEAGKAAAQIRFPIAIPIACAGYHHQPPGVGMQAQRELNSA